MSSLLTDKDFAMTERQFTRYMRDENAPKLNDIDPDRLELYREITFVNVEELVGEIFPVLHSVYEEDAWEKLMCDFIRDYHSQTFLFYKISEEFVKYIAHQRDVKNDPPFIKELVHYEWVEIALNRSSDDIVWDGIKRHGDLLNAHPVISHLACVLAYQFPVHRIGENFQPQTPGEQPTYLIVYRNLDDVVKFMEVNATTARLVQILESDEKISGSAAIQQLAVELQHADPESLTRNCYEILKQFHDLGIVLGSKD